MAQKVEMIFWSSCLDAKGKFQDCHLIPAQWEAEMLSLIVPPNHKRRACSVPKKHVFFSLTFPQPICLTPILISPSP